MKTISGRKRTLTVWLVVFCALAAAAGGAALVLARHGDYAEFGRDPSPAAPSGLRASGSLDFESGPENAADGDTGSAWRPPVDSVSSWLILDFEEPLDAHSLLLDADIPEGSGISVQYLREGVWLPFADGYAGEGSGTRVLDLSYESIRTSGFRLAVSGMGVAVREIEVRAWSGTEASRLVRPVRAASGTGTIPLFDAEWLLDGNPRTTWKTGYWSLPGLLPGFSRFDLERAEPSARKAARKAAGMDTHRAYGPDEGRFNHGTLEGGVYFAFEKPATVRAVRVFFTDEASGDLRILAKLGEDWVPVGTIPGHAGNGWSGVEFAPVEAEAFKLLLDLRYGNTASLGEVEFWGGGGQSASFETLGDPFGVRSDGRLVYRLPLPRPEDYAVEIMLRGGEAVELAVETDGWERSARMIRRSDGRTLYRLDLEARDVSEDEAWIAVTLPEGGTIEFTRARELRSTGYFSASSGGILGDGFVLAETDEPTESVLEFGRSLLLDGAEVRGSGSFGSRLFTRNGEEWTELVTESFGPERRTFDAGLVTDAVLLEGPSGLSELRLAGSPTADAPPSYQILLPEGDTISSIGMILGVVDDAAAEIRINGLPAQRAGNFFFLPANGLITPGSEVLEAAITATDSSGRVTSGSESWYLEGVLPWIIDGGSETCLTTEPTVTITGRIPGPFWSVTADGIPAEIRAGRFTVTVPVEPGFNAVRLSAKPRGASKAFASRVLRVVRYSAGLTVQVTVPHDGAWLSSGSAVFYGTLSGAALPVTVTAASRPAVVDGSVWRSAAPLPLEEGANQVDVFARDALGRIARVRTTVLVDRTAPTISVAYPSAGAYVSTGTVAVSANVSDSGPVSVRIGGRAARLTDGLYTAAISLGEGPQSVPVVAVDAAGNSRTVYAEFFVDTIPPDPFEVLVDPPSWTSHTMPSVGFGTADSGSGIDRYEVMIDGGTPAPASSPFECPVLPDGIHLITVTAYDRAGNARSASREAYIDTTPSGPPEVFTAVAGVGFVDLFWERPAEDVVQYRIERSPAWEDGPRILSETSYRDSGDGFDPGEIFKYYITAIDRADNASGFAEAEASVGFQLVVVDEANPGELVAFDEARLYIPEEALPEGILAIQATTVVSEQLETAAVFGMAGPIYSFSAVVDDGSGPEIRQDVRFENEYIGYFQYDESLIPEGFPEENLGVYYYDTMWSRWFKVDKCAVDTEQNAVVFATTHFTSFSVQPTVIQDLSPQELADVGYSPFKGQTEHGGVTVSTQGGSAMMEATEFVLPGKAGFDFTLKRTYDTATARGDSPGLALNAALSFSLHSVIKDISKLGQILESDGLQSILNGVSGSLRAAVQDKIRGIFQSYGDYAYSTGLGWRLNLPYIKATGTDVLVRTPSGAFYPVNNMSLVSNAGLFGIYRELILENHEGEDFTLKVTQGRFDLSTMSRQLRDRAISANASIVNDLVQITLPSWQLVKASLILKDGTRYEFDWLGRVTSIEDPTGENSVAFEYGGFAGYFLESITDSMGRRLLFEYDYGSALDDAVMPHITSITLEGDPAGRRVIYEYSSRTKDGRDHLGVPLLSQAQDPVGRTWDYQYDWTPLVQGSVGVKINFAQLIAEACGIGWLTGNFLPPSFTLKGNLSTEVAYTVASVDGPGKGYTEIDTDKDTFFYGYLGLADFVFGFIPTGVEGSLNFPAKMFTSSVTEYVTKGGEKLKTTTYDYSFQYVKEHQIANTRTIENDGRKTITHYYDITTKTRRRYLTAEDYVAQAIEGIVMPSVTFREKVPYESKYVVKDGAGNVLETTEIEYNLSTMRQTKRTVERSDSQRIVQEYKYDAWGNVTQSKETLTAGDEIAVRTVTSAYRVRSPGGDQAGYYPSGSPYTPPTLTRLRQDLKLYERTAYTVPREAGGTDEESTLVLYAYDAVGHRTAESQKTGSSYLETRYEYDPDGELSRVDKPAGSGGRSVTELTRDYSGPSYYTVETRIRDADLGGTVSDIVTKTWHDRWSGLPRFTRDARGYVGATEYDALGRPVRRISPDDGDAPFGDPAADPAFLSDNPTLVIAYDDDAYDVTVTGVRGQRTLYDFDKAGRLIGIAKTIRALNPDGTPAAATARVETVVVGRNKYGEIAHIVDQNGHRTDYEYDALGRIKRLVHPEEDGARAERTMTYDYASNKETTTDERGYVTETRYDMAGRVLGTTAWPDAPGKAGRPVTASARYDGLGRPAVSVDSLGGVTVNTYDERGLPASTLQPEARFYEGGAFRTGRPRIQYAYDDAGTKILETLATPAGSYATAYENNALGWPLAVSRNYTDYSGGTPKAAAARELYRYDPAGNIVRKVDANDGTKPESQRLSSTTLWSARGKPLSETDRAGNTTTYQYDGEDNLVRMVDPRGNDPAYAYGLYEARFAYDDAGRLVLGILPSAAGGTATARVELDYDPRGNLVRRVDADGTRTVYTYTARNKPRTETLGVQNPIVTLRTYDPSANEIETLVGVVEKTTRTYDGLGRVLKTERPSGSYETAVYDAAGNPLRVENGEGHATTFEYDVYGRAVKTTDARGGVKTVAYDARGLATREADENGNVRLLDYDELGRLVKETRADGSVYRYAYDAVGNPTWTRDARGVETVWTYTAVYKPAAIVKTKDGSADSKTYTWDAAGLVTSASGSGAAYAYNRDAGTGTYRSDPYGRTRAVLAAVGGADLVARFDYDEAGRTLSAAYPGGAAVSYTYDDRGLLSGVPSWTEPGSHQRTTAGRPLSHTLANGAAASRSWDSDGRLTRIGYTGPSGFALAGYDITWDRAGNITTKNGNTYHYDELERLSYADEKGTGTASRMIPEASAAEEDHTGQEDLTLVAADTEIRVDKASTSVGTTFTGEVSVTKLTLKAPSPGHRVKARNVEAWILKDGSEAWEKVAHAAASVNPEGDVSLSFARSEDAVGVKVHCLYDERDLQDQALDYATFIQRSDSILEVSYHTSRRIETYQYDAKGNRIEVSTTGVGEGSSETTTKGAAYWPNTDRIKTYGSWTYVWDEAGNLVEKGTEYAEGTGFSTDTGLYIRYEYDLWNRMTAVYKGESGTASSNLAATYAYGPDDIRVSKVSAAVGGTAWLHDPAGRVHHEAGPDYARDYVWAEGVLLGYEEERDTDGDGTRERFRRYILTDHLGSAIAVLDEEGNLLSTTDYSAFGESGDASPVLAPIYTGKQWDADAGLYYFNARWYDPELGRFTTEDPIKDGGNWYAYVGNRPLVATDPTGLGPPTQKVLDERAAKASEPKPYSPRAVAQTGEDVKPHQFTEEELRQANEVLMLEGSIAMAFAGLAVEAVDTAGDAIELGVSLIRGDAASAGLAAANLAAPAVVEAVATTVKTIRKGAGVADTVSTVVKSTDDVAEAAESGLKAGEHTVYGLKDPITGEIKYVGRTIDPKARALAHTASPDKAGLDFTRLKGGLTYPEARGWEQKLFEQYGGFDKLLNRINPISPKNPNLPLYLKAAGN